MDEAQSRCINNLTSEFNHAHLHNKCQQEYRYEEVVVEEVVEHVELILVQLPCINLVEYLHENKALED